MSGRAQWPGWVLITLGVVSWFANATTDDLPASRAEALGRLSFSIALLVWGVVLLRRARRDRDGTGP